MRRHLGLASLVLAACIAGCAHHGVEHAPPTHDAVSTSPPPSQPRAPSFEEIAAMPRTPITAEERTAWPRYGDSVFVDVAPEKWGMVPPAYPDSAREAGVDGTVWVAALVRTDGSVGATLVTKEIPLLNGAATAALMKWRFKPAMAHGKPVATWVTEPVKFALH